MRSLGLILGGLLFFGGCDDEDSAPVAEPPVDTAGPTYHADVQAIITEHCTACHTAGGAAPFAFDDPAVAQMMAGAALDAIESGRMPPWQPDSDCNQYQNERLMPEGDKAVFRTWVAAGAPMGEAPEVAVSPQVVELPEADMVTRSAAPYLPSVATPDDYRCFPLDAEFAEDTFLRGTAVVPDARATVHHVIVYVVPPDRVEEMQAKEAAEEGAGYTCYGGTGLGDSNLVAGWVPGMAPEFMEDGSAQFIPAGSRLLMQIHYNVLNAEPVPDQTAVNLYTWDVPQPNVIEFKLVADADLRIPAGEAELVNVRTVTHYGKEPIEIVGLLPHMHVLGTSISMQLQRPDDSASCLVDIPKWDFNWQQIFDFRPGESFMFNPGDSLALTCTYDNSAGNQPTLNGEQRVPRDVSWGEGTLDEMCVTFIKVRRPFEADGPDFEGCRAACDDPSDFHCLADCLSEDTNTAVCAFSEMLTADGCGQPCLVDGIRAQACVSRCFNNGISTAGATASCMADVCPDEFEPLAACMTDAVRSGTCEAAIEACTR